MQFVARWRALEADGLEHLQVRLGSDGVLAEALVIGGAGAQAFGLSYRVVCDPAWRVREVFVACVGSGREVRLRADGEGRWEDGRGRRLAKLDGCIDVDIAVTPFTNTLPIRRLDLAPGESRDIRVAYIVAPSLEVTAVSQRYTRMHSGRIYRYEGYPTGFSADVTTDADGLVIEYPGLFRRIF